MIHSLLRLVEVCLVSLILQKLSGGGRTTTISYSANVCIFINTMYHTILLIFQYSWAIKYQKDYLLKEEKTGCKPTLQHAINPEQLGQILQCLLLEKYMNYLGNINQTPSPKRQTPPSNPSPDEKQSHKIYLHCGWLWWNRGDVQYPHISMIYSNGTDHSRHHGTHDIPHGTEHTLYGVSFPHYMVCFKGYCVSFYQQQYILSFLGKFNMYRIQVLWENQTRRVSYGH